mmetsp:Transcript_41650/g.40021  ORF Transcript_41650/g.40021 Transcript_41650/m.40021 type:complete len:290 (+) Transcript_41650:1245-2114(+)
MFEATGWVLEEPDSNQKVDDIVLAYVRPASMDPSKFQYKKEEDSESECDSLSSVSEVSSSKEDDAGFNNYQLAIIKRFDFSSKMQRMSVIVKNMIDGNLHAFVKGSPEVIRELSLEKSLPENFEEILKIYTEYGYRVLGLAHRFLPFNYIKAQRVERVEVEQKLNFLGFIIMQNKLKPVTSSVIETLNNANIRTIMATGDNILTAVSVGRECQIIDAETEVFFGDIMNVPGGGQKVVWKSTQSQKHRLHSGTLEPNKKFFEDEKGKLGSHVARNSDASDSEMQPIPTEE